MRSFIRYVSKNKGALISHAFLVLHQRIVAVDRVVDISERLLIPLSCELEQDKFSPQFSQPSPMRLSSIGLQSKFGRSGKICSAAVANASGEGLPGRILAGTGRGTES